MESCHPAPKCQTKQPVEIFENLFKKESKAKQNNAHHYFSIKWRTITALKHQ